MKVVVVGATGGIGRLVTEQALAAGHDVVAVARNPATLPPAVHGVAVDLMSDAPEVVAGAIGGADAVLSTLGPRSSREIGIMSRGMRTVIEAMRATGVQRVVAISAAPIATVASPGRPAPPDSDPGDGFVMRHFLAPLMKVVFRAPYADTALMEDHLRGSGLDWTAIRPPRLTDKPLTGSYRTAIGHNVRRGLSISRADVAHLMLHVIDQPESFNRTMGIAN